VTALFPHNVTETALLLLAFCTALVSL
jgi:hypothetical protein